MTQQGFLLTAEERAMAACHPIRLEMVNYLRSNPNSTAERVHDHINTLREVNILTLMGKLPRTSPLTEPHYIPLGKVKIHLAKLKRTGFLTVKRNQDSTKLYSIDAKQLKQFNKAIKNFNEKYAVIEQAVYDPNMPKKEIFD